MTPREQFTLKIQTDYGNARKCIREGILDASSPTKEVDIRLAYEQSKALLGQYVTLDWEHRNDILKIRRAISKYAQDRTRKRPLNIVMQAEPGSGKSHLVKCLARSLAQVDAASVVYNMANLQSIEDLAQPLDAIRNLKVIDKLPILFLDEFDSDPDRYALLLPLLWDGELHIGHRDLKLGKLVILLAGSGSSVENAIKAAKGMHPPEGAAESKLVDLLSRINGGEVSIPPLDLVQSNRDRQVDKVCLTITLIENRFGDQFQTVPWSLLKFVGSTRFRYGVRSIAHLIDLLSPADKPLKPEPTSDTEISHKQLSLPLETVDLLRNSSLAYHLIAEDGPAAIVDAWKQLKVCETMVRVRAESTEDDFPF